MLRSLLNQRLGRYYIKELLGRGGMAAVYRAADTVLQRDIALKILYPQYSDDAGLVARFKREAVTAAALDHPNIVPVYDVDEQDGMAYIAMKLLSGRTLQDRLQEAGAISLEELIALLAPVASALDYAHGRGVIHRDIKPGNIFLSQEGDGARAMLTDFGIAKQLDAPGLTTTGALIGTPDYMAPEQIAGRALDARVDVYALGMLAFRALAGRRAFEGTTQDVLLGHLYGRAPLLSELNPALPQGLDAVVGQAIAVEPAARYPSAGAFVQALRQVARGTTATTAVGGPVVARHLEGALPAGGSAAATAVGMPPPLAGISPPTGHAHPPTPPPQTDQMVRTAAAAAAAAPPAPPSRPVAPRSGSGAAPWLVAVVMALIAGGLAVALLFATGRQAAGGAATTVPPPPPSATTQPPTSTAAPPSPTTDQAALATATVEATATAEPPSPTAAPPTAPPQPATVAPLPPPAATPTLTPTLPPTATTAPTETATETATVTATATATSTSTPTASPTVLAGCDTSLLGGGFAQLYDDRGRVRDGLGCPLERESVGQGSQQFFAQGTMLYWDDSNRDARADYIFVFYVLNGGNYAALSNREVQALGPEPTPGPDPNQPRRGFGTVYFNKPGTRELLGPAISPEILLRGDQSGVIQFFDQGIMLWTPLYVPTGKPSIFVLYDDGTFERYDDAAAG